MLLQRMPTHLALPMLQAFEHKGQRLEAGAAKEDGSSNEQEDGPCGAPLHDALTVLPAVTGSCCVAARLHAGEVERQGGDGVIRHSRMQDRTRALKPHYNVDCPAGCALGCSLRAVMWAWRVGGAVVQQMGAAAGGARHSAGGLLDSLPKRRHPITARKAPARAIVTACNAAGVPRPAGPPCIMHPVMSQRAS